MSHLIFFILLLAVAAQVFSNEPRGNCDQLKKLTILGNINVIPMDREVVLRNQTVFIEKGYITRVTPFKDSHSEWYKNPCQRYINGSGKYVLPGFVDMHVHLPGNRNIPWFPGNGIDNIEEILTLYIANGITTVRSMLGEPYVLKLRDIINQGKLLGPRIFTASPSIDGINPESSENLYKKIQQYKQAGYDSIKIRPGLTANQFNEVVRISKVFDIPFCGHISSQVGIRQSLKSGYKSIEHLDGYIEGLVPVSTSLDPKDYGLFGYRYVKNIDLKLLPALIRVTKDTNVWITPTQSMLERWSLYSKHNLNNLPEMKYVSSSIKTAWSDIFKRKSMQRYIKESAKFLEIRRHIIKEMQRQNIGLLMGSDSPQMYSIPGFSALSELEALVSAGLSNYQALVTATVNPAKYYKKQDQFGSIKTGLKADLVILNQNPLKNIKTVYDRSAVIVRGEYFSEKELSIKLKAIAEKYLN